MCGIAGVYDPKGIDVEEFYSLSKVLRHRGPDDEGFFVADEDSVMNCKGEDTISQLQKLPHLSQGIKQPNLAFLHRRLSILDVSELGHQPYSLENGNYVLVFNGEVYNFKEIRKELEYKGHIFNSASDTEVVLKSYIEWGKDCVSRFMGMWAFTIYDRKKNLIFLSRDRFGIKPLYYFVGDTFFAFASEIKALLKMKAVDGSISNENLGSYLVYGTTVNPYQNLFQSIIDAEPGCNYEYDLLTKKVKKENYFSLDDEVQKNTEEIDVNSQKFEELFTESMRLHLRSDVEVGSCLSGGLDSSAIVYSASRQLDKKLLKTFTAAYQNTSVDESEYAKLVEKQLINVEGEYIYPEAKTLISEMDKMIYHQDLPIGSTSIFAQWEVMKGVNQNRVKVLLDGQGADEILGGYYNFAGLHLIELLRSCNFLGFIKQYFQLKNNFTPQMRTAVLRAAYYYLPKKLQEKLRAKERLSFNFIKPEIENDLLLDIPNRGGKTFDKHVDLSVKYGMYELLRYEDRNSMAFSVESRVPFLDHRLVNFIRSLPNDQKICGGWTKYVLRKMLDKKLDDKVVWRKDKKGFVTPQQDWKNELMSSLIAQLKESDMPSLMNRKYIIELCDKDFSNASHLSEFWRAYSVIKWYNIFNLRS